MYNIGIIGAGKVGVSLGRYLSGLEYTNLVGYYSRSLDSSAYAAKVTNSGKFTSIEKLVEKSNVILITTPDDQISEIWSTISKFSIQNKIVCHCSGSLSSEIFFDISSKGASGCSMHPILAISSKENSYKDLASAFFTLEGQDEAIEFFSKVLDSKGNKYKVLSSREKTKYHISSVFISNLIIAIGNMNKLFAIGPQDALTGPVERNDLGTVERHLKALDHDHYDNIEKIYRLLSLELVDLAREKNCDRDYSRLENLLLKGPNPQVMD